MTNDHERSRLDGIIDAVVHDMMQADPRGDLAGRVRRALDEPARRPWFVSAPALAAASFAVVILVAAVMILLDRGATPAVPSIEVASGMPANVGSPVQAPRLTGMPAAGSARPARPAQAPAVASSESIFGPRRDQVGAASVRPASVWLQLTLVETSVDGTSRRHPVTLVLPGDASQAGRPQTAGEGSFRAAVTHGIVAGVLQIKVEMSAPLQRQFTATLQPGERTRVFEELDPRSGARTAIEALARVPKAGTQR
jgi:hypothetical protein